MSKFAFSKLGPLVRLKLLQVKHDQRGVTAFEFAMIAPILIALAVSTIDLGIGIYTDTQLSNSAQTGAYYAMQYGYSVDAITAAAQSASRLKDITVTPTQICGCPSGSGGVTQASCTATCSDGLIAGAFAQVTAAKDYTPLLPYPGLPAVYHLSKQATVRLQ